MMKIRQWVVSALVVGLVALGWAAAAAAQDTRTEGRLQAEATTLDTTASGLSATPEGQRKISESLARQFEVEESVVTGLRSKQMGWGNVTTTLALSQQLMKQDPALTRQQAIDRILAQREAGKGWGVIAHEMDLKLGRVISEVKRADKSVARLERVQRAEKAERHPRVDRPEKIEKAERRDRFERPEKVHRAERPERPEKVR